MAAKVLLRDIELTPGWLKRQFSRIAALQRAHRKILRASMHGETSIKFTVAELCELVDEVRATGIK